MSKMETCEGCEKEFWPDPSGYCLDCLEADNKAHHDLIKTLQAKLRALEPVIAAAVAWSTGFQQLGPGHHGRPHELAAALNRAVKSLPPEYLTKEGEKA